MSDDKSRECRIFVALEREIWVEKFVQVPHAIAGARDQGLVSGI